MTPTQGMFMSDINHSAGGFLSLAKKKGLLSDKMFLLLFVCFHE